MRPAQSTHAGVYPNESRYLLECQEQQESLLANPLLQLSKEAFACLIVEVGLKVGPCQYLIVETMVLFFKNLSRGHMMVAFHIIQTFDVDLLLCCSSCSPTRMTPHLSRKLEQSRRRTSDNGFKRLESRRLQHRQQCKINKKVVSAQSQQISLLTHHCTFRFCS